MRPGSKLYEDDVELQKELEAAALAAEKNQLGVEAGQVGNWGGMADFIGANGVLTPDSDYPSSPLRKAGFREGVLSWGF